VKLLGREGAWREPGISHNHIEIIGITRVMPNLVIVDPADIVEAENASIIGGLGEAVATVLAEYSAAPLIRIGIEDEFSQSGRIMPEIDELKTHFGLGAEDVALSVKECIAKRERLKRRK
jgi:transketolase C-terminal domain/subunit